MEPKRGMVSFSLMLVVLVRGLGFRRAVLVLILNAGGAYGDSDGVSVYLLSRNLSQGNFA